MSKHTPGQWVIRGSEIGVRDTSDTMSNGMMLTVCDVNKWDFKDEWEANARLIAAAPDLLEALEACADALWEDSREIRMDDTMMMGPGYDWDGWENFRWELHTRKGSFAIWPAHGTYSAYGGLDGSYWNQCFSSASEAKAAIVEYVAKIDPTHPAALARAAIAKVKGEQA